MKKVKFFLVVVFAAVMAVSCEFEEFEPPVPTEDQIASQSNLVLKSASGFNSEVGTIYVQQGVGTGMKVESKTASAVTAAKWTIESTTYEAVQIAHKFTGLGSVTVKVVATFADNSTETRTFTVQSVPDIGKAEPIRYFVTAKTDGSWDVLFLFSKERLRYATDNVFYFTGSVTGWQKTAVPDADKNYVIGTDGKPAVTTDVGKYVGVKLNLKTREEYSIALVHSGNVWADYSGSSFVKAAEPGLAIFWFDAGTITPRGDSYTAENLPGASGDGYFRFDQLGDATTGKVTLFFRLDGNFTTAAFVVRELEGGTYGAPIQMYSVQGFPEWGQIELPITEMLGKVCGFRYGPNSASPAVYSAGMSRSFFYDSYFKNIRISLLKV